MDFEDALFKFGQDPNDPYEQKKGTCIESLQNLTRAVQTNTQR